MTERLIQKLEDAVQGPHGDAVHKAVSQASIAISLKRIADSLEQSQVVASELDERDRRLAKELALSISRSSRSVVNILIPLIHLLVEKEHISPDDLEKMLDDFENIFDDPEKIDDEAKYERELSISISDRLRRIFFPESNGS